MSVALLGWLLFSTPAVFAQDDGDEEEARQRLESGRKLAKEKKYAEACEEFAKALKLNPKLAEAWRERGRANYALKAYDAARVDVERTVELAPQDGDAHFLLGMVRRQLGKDAEAEESYSKCIELLPKAVNAYLNRGNIRFAAGRFPEALEDYTKAVELEGGKLNGHRGRGHVMLVLEQYDDAETEFTEALKVKSDDFIALMGRGFARLESGKLEAAMADCEAAVKADGKSAGALACRAMVKLAKGDEAGAAEDVDAARKLSTTDYRVKLAHARALEKKGDLSAAVKAYAEAGDGHPLTAVAWKGVLRCLALSKRSDAGRERAACDKLLVWFPEDPAINFRRGMLLKAERRFKEAEHDLMVAWQGAPEMLEAAVALAEIQLEKYPMELEEALVFADGAVQVEKDDLSARVVRARVLIELAEWTRAAEDVAKARELAPADLGVMELDVKVLKGANNVAGAVEVLSRILNKEPKRPEAREERSRLYVRLGKHAEAIRDAEDVVREQPKNPSAVMILADAHVAAGDVASAVKALEAGITAVPESQPLVSRLGEVQFAGGRFAEAELSFAKAGRLAKYTFPDFEYVCRAVILARAAPTKDVGRSVMMLQREFRLHGELKPDPWTVQVFQFLANPSVTPEKLMASAASPSAAKAIVEKAAQAVKAAEEKLASAGDEEKLSAEHDVTKAKRALARVEKSFKEDVEYTESQARAVIGIRFLGNGDAESAKAWFEKSDSPIAKAELARMKTK